MGRYNDLHIDVRLKQGALCLDVRFNAPPGITALIGASGAGKTTIANMIAGHITPDSGTIRLGQKSLYVAEANLNLPIEDRTLGYVLQDNLLFPHLSVIKNIQYGAQGNQSRIANAIALLELEPLLAHLPHQLSGGEKKRVAIARAIAAPINGLILDEPLNGLDPGRRERLYPYLERIAQQTRLPILFISHQCDEVMRLADHVVVIDSGRIRCSGELLDVMTHKAFRDFAGKFDSGAVLNVTLEKEHDGLQHWRTAETTIYTTATKTPIGAKARLRILARDVALAKTRPENVSVLNILPVTITNIDTDADGECELELALEHGGIILARITHHSFHKMDLKSNDRLYAMIKAVAVVSAQ